jgi:hypothetical protein
MEKRSKRVLSFLALLLVMALAAAQEQAMIRLAHLSPNIPEVDVRLLQAPAATTAETSTASHKSRSTSHA